MPQVPDPRPFDECDLADQPRFDPSALLHFLCGRGLSPSRGFFSGRFLNEQIFSPYGGKVLWRHEPCEDLIRVMAAKVEKSVALALGTLTTEGIGKFACGLIGEACYRRFSSSAIATLLLVAAVARVLLDAAGAFPGFSLLPLLPGFRLLPLLPGFSPLRFSLFVLFAWSPTIALSTVGAAEVRAALSRAVWAAVVWRDCAEELLADSVVEHTPSAVSVVESTASADSLVRFAFASENAFACFLVF